MPATSLANQHPLDLHGEDTRLAARPGTGATWKGTLPQGDPDRVANILADWMTMSQVAELAGMKTENLAGKVRRNTFLPPTGRIGRTPIWRRTDVETYLEISS